MINMVHTATVFVFLFSQTSWLVLFSIKKFDLLKDSQSIFIAGVATLTLVTLVPFLVFRRFFRRVGPLMYVMTVFSWSCMIDLGFGLELDGFISNYVAFYLAEGEPYLMTAHGAAICYWDGIVHFGLYLTIIDLYSRRKSYREVGLYWCGTMLQSMIVLLQGGIAGNQKFKLSILLNTPYMLLPLLAAFKFLHDRPPQPSTPVKPCSGDRRLVDLLFFVYFIAAIFLAIFRALAVLGGTADIMKEYLTTYESYLLDPTNFPKFQILSYGYFFLVYYLSAAYGLLYPGQTWMADWSLIHAGAAAQAQFSHLFGSCHHRTPQNLLCPRSGYPALVFWVVNLTLFVVPHIFAWWCLRDAERFGFTRNTDSQKLSVERVNNKQAKNK